MKRCPISYQPIPESEEYSKDGRHLLSRSTKTLLHPFPYSVEEQLSLAVQMAPKLSIQGVQPKISVRFNAAAAAFIPAERKGNFILKPQNLHYPHLPENEDLSMRLAKLAGCSIPPHGLIRGSDYRLIYFIKRFDRIAKGRKLPTEDFAQLAGLSRETKYAYSIEKIVTLLDRYMTFPMIEKAGFFRLLLVNFLLGNEDAHLKNWSVITRSGRHELSPCYDIVNTTLALGSSAVEESALPLNGKKSRLTAEDFFTYLGKERLQLTPKVLDKIKEELQNSLPHWEQLIAISFLPQELRKRYQEIVDERAQRLFL